MDMHGLETSDAAVHLRTSTVLGNYSSLIRKYITPLLNVAETQLFYYSFVFESKRFFPTVCHLF